MREVEERLHGAREIGVAEIFECHPMPHSQVVRMLDVVIEHLREKQQRLVRSDRKSVADRQFRGKHALRQRHQARRSRTRKIEEGLMSVRLEIDIHMAHQLGQLRRRSSSATISVRMPVIHSTQASRCCRGRSFGGWTVLPSIGICGRSCRPSTGSGVPRRCRGSSEQTRQIARRITV